MSFRPPATERPPTFEELEMDPSIRHTPQMWAHQTSSDAFSMPGTAWPIRTMGFDVVKDSVSAANLLPRGQRYGEQDAVSVFAQQQQLGPSHAATGSGGTSSHDLRNASQGNFAPGVAMIGSLAHKRSGAGEGLRSSASRSASGTAAAPPTQHEPLTAGGDWLRATAAAPPPPPPPLQQRPPTRDATSSTVAVPTPVSSMVHEIYPTTTPPGAAPAAEDTGALSRSTAAGIGSKRRDPLRDKSTSSVTSHGCPEDSRAPKSSELEPRRDERYSSVSEGPLPRAPASRNSRSGSPESTSGMDDSRVPSEGALVSTSGVGYTALRAAATTSGAAGGAAMQEHGAPRTPKTPIQEIELANTSNVPQDSGLMSAFPSPTFDERSGVVHAGETAASRHQLTAAPYSAASNRDGDDRRNAIEGTKAETERAEATAHKGTGAAANDFPSSLRSQTTPCRVHDSAKRNTPRAHHATPTHSSSSSTPALVRLADIDRLRDQKRADDLRIELHRSAARIGALTATLQELTEAHEMLHGEEAALRAELITAESEFQHAKKECAELEKEMRDSLQLLLGQLHSKRERVERLRAENKRLRASVDVSGSS